MAAALLFHYCTVCNWLLNLQPDLKIDDCNNCITPCLKIHHCNSTHLSQVACPCEYLSFYIYWKLKSRNKQKQIFWLESAADDSVCKTFHIFNLFIILCIVIRSSYTPFLWRIHIWYVSDIDIRMTFVWYVLVKCPVQNIIF